MLTLLRLDTGPFADSRPVRRGVVPTIGGHGPRAAAPDRRVLATLVTALGDARRGRGD